MWPCIVQVWRCTSFSHWWRSSVRRISNSSCVRCMCQCVQSWKRPYHPADPYVSQRELVAKHSWTGQTELNPKFSVVCSLEICSLLSKIIMLEPKFDQKRFSFNKIMPETTYNFSSEFPTYLQSQVRFPVAWKPGMRQIPSQWSLCRGEQNWACRRWATQRRRCHS